MALERASGGTSLIDVVDRVLDKGCRRRVGAHIVGWVDLITVEARIVVASIDTYLKYAEVVGLTPAVSRPALAPGPEVVEERTPSRTRSETDKERR